MMKNSCIAGTTCPIHHWVVHTWKGIVQEIRIETTQENWKRKGIITIIMMIIIMIITNVTFWDIIFKKTQSFDRL